MMADIWKAPVFDLYDPRSRFMKALRKALAPVKRPDGPMVWDTTPETSDSFRLIWSGTTDYLWR